MAFLEAELKRLADAEPDAGQVVTWHIRQLALCSGESGALEHKAAVDEVTERDRRWGPARGTVAFLQVAQDRLAGAHVHTWSGLDVQTGDHTVVDDGGVAL